MTTRELLTRELGRERPGRGVRHRFFLPTCQPLQFTPPCVGLNPYALGLLLGDGAFSDATISFAIADQELVDALLQGNMDTDGWVEGGTAAGFCVVSRQLAGGVQFVAETLGCVATRSSASPTYTRNGERPTEETVYRPHITTPRELSLFRLDRKRLRVRHNQRRADHAITSLEPGERGEAVGITVAALDRRFLAQHCLPAHGASTYQACVGVPE